MKKIAEALLPMGLAYDKSVNVIFGTYQDFPVYITQINSGNSSSYTLTTTAIRDGQGLPKELWKEVKENSEKTLANVSSKEFKVTATLKGRMTRKKVPEDIKTAIAALIDFLKAHDFAPACEETGQTTNLDIYSIGGVVRILSQSVYAQYSKDLDASEQLHSQKTENYFLGTVGAFLGSLIGVAVIVVISQLGYVAALSGIVMGIVTVKGYELFARKFSKVGAIICSIIVILMTYFANELDWAILVARYVEVDIITAFQGLSELKANDYIDMSSYSTNLFMLFAFTLITAGVTIWGAMKDSDNKFVTRPLSAE